METNLHKSTLLLPTPAIQQPIPTRFLSRWTPYEKLINQLEKGNTRWGMQTFMLAVQGNILAPVALLIIQYYDFGYQDYFAGLLAVLFLGVLVMNLAVLPVRLIVNVFLLNVAIHAALIAWHLLR